MAMGDHLRCHRWSGGGHLWQPYLVQGDHPQQHILPQMVRGDLFWGDHLWHDSTYQYLYSKLPFVFTMYELVLKEKPTLLVWNYFELQICVDVTLSSYLLYHEQQMWEEVSASKEGGHA